MQRLEVNPTGREIHIGQLSREPHIHVPRPPHAPLSQHLEGGLVSKVASHLPGLRHKEPAVAGRK